MYSHMAHGTCLVEPNNYILVLHLLVAAVNDLMAKPCRTEVILSW